MHRKRRQEGWIAASVIAVVFLALLLINKPSKHDRPIDSSIDGVAETASSLEPRLDDGATSNPSMVASVRSVDSSSRDTWQPQPGAFPFRLSNTLQPLNALARNEYALLLNNAFLDSRIEMDFSIPDHLRSSGAPGAYIVQSEGPVTPEFVQWLEAQGGEIVAYVPNNAYLTRLPDSRAKGLSSSRRVAAVVAYEPYFKIERSLLPDVIYQRPLTEDRLVRLVGFPGTGPALEAAFAGSNLNVVSSGPVPFGPSYVVSGPDVDVARWARSPDVQFVELARDRVAANDLARQRTNVEVPILIPAEEEGEEDVLSSTNYLGLTGMDIPVNVNDTGVDAGHPDLAGRVFPGDPADTSTISDRNGHGTHVAGTIASSGENSPEASEEGAAAAPGSEVDADYRGMAPDATIHALPIDLDIGPSQSDAYLITKAAEKNYETLSRTNPMVSNNSWGYLNANDYDSASASYDAAVRDALPETSGAQSLVYVFAAGNEGEAFANGTGGLRGTIRSPGNAKNVITVGAIETFRNITNEFYITNVVEDLETGEMVDQIITNVYFLEDTDSSTEVAAFSSRGNVSIGVEGEEGRFKPDVVAPGTFIASARSAQWTSPASDIDREIVWIRDRTVAPGVLDQHVIFIGDDTTSVTIEIVPNDASSNPTELLLPLYATYGELASLADFVSVDQLRLPDDLQLIPLRTLNYAVGNLGAQSETFDIRVIIESENQGGGDRLEALAEINEPLAPHYRYESGTSMAAPVVSGALALIQQYLEENEHGYSAALLKAMLINGARSVSNTYGTGLSEVCSCGAGIYIQ